MTDRELLEMAAKAAGVAGHFVEKGPLDGYPRYSCGIGKAHHLVMLWNPLECDGDALRLAVALDISLLGDYPQNIVVVAFDARRITEKHDGDRLSATRRAIVRAAAAIGSAM